MNAPALRAAAITARDLPTGSPLARYRACGAYADCYGVDVAAEVSIEAFVSAFLTTRLFRVERAILPWLGMPRSTDEEARALARGERETFAAWRVESRGPDHLLLCDLLGHTRSWYRVEPLPGGGTGLRFGSAVVPSRRTRSGRPAFGLAFHLLSGFHRLYARALLASARRALDRSGRPG